MDWGVWEWSIATVWAFGMAMLFVILAANIATVMWCTENGGHTETPFMTTYCRMERVSGG